MIDTAFLRQIEGFSLTTAEIIYRLPDHQMLLQSYLAGLRRGAALSEAHRLPRFLGGKSRWPALSRSRGASGADRADRVQLHPRRAQTALAGQPAILDLVMPGLDPGIHTVKDPRANASMQWIARSSPAMTVRVKHNAPNARSRIRRCGPALSPAPASASGMRSDKGRTECAGIGDGQGGSSGTCKASSRSAP